ncbi:HD domain-containing protein [Mobilitalea sibirica]|uniref:HD domain-containing protein n=1 Tax=Mobilitalea sibirica TaxID=1462919 RepID=A0A8J7GZQ7_9FIRM|nr:HD domain-containing protein [Mobilitalea sibirica]MBH1939285.1 HD domain-containing protein [Mobilitalea sibirica]
MTRLEQQINFIIEVDKLKNIIRQNYLVDGSRKEDDADHSWHLALMCAILSEHANEKIDVLKTMVMVLIHDLVEIDAGDTYAYDSNANVSKRERELEAADRIFRLLPADQAQEIRALWDEFEEGRTPEAKFAVTLDKVQPLLLNSGSDGKSWKEHKVTLSQILKRNENTGEGSQALWDYGYQLIQKNVDNNNIINQ